MPLEDTFDCFFRSYINSFDSDLIGKCGLRLEPCNNCDFESGIQKSVDDMGTKVSRSL